MELDFLTVACAVHVHRHTNETVQELESRSMMWSTFSKQSSYMGATIDQL